MSRFFAISLRAQLFLIASIIALPAVGIIIHSGFSHRDEAIAHARAEVEKLANNIAHEQQSLVASARQLANALAQLPDVKNGNKPRIEQVLADILKINPQYLNIFIVDRHGALWASAIPSKSSPPISVADRRHFINARATGQFSSGECIVGRLLGQPTISFGYPFNDRKGTFDGVIVINFNLGYGGQVLKRSKLPTGANYALLDHRGVILGRGIRPELFVGKQDTAERFTPMQQGPDTASFIGPGMAGDQRYITYRKLRLDGEETPYMYVRAGIAVDQVLAQANAALLKNLSLLTPFLVLAFFLAWLMGKRSIVDRVSTLQAASQRLAGGDLQVRVGHLVKGGELGSLGRSFDEMAAALQQDEQERTRQEEALQAKALVLDNMVEGVSECTREGSIVSTNPAFDRMFGYEPGELLGRELGLLNSLAGDGYTHLLRDIAQQVETQKVWTGEFLNLRKDGKTFFTSARISELSSTRHWVIVVEDVTELKQMERMKDEILSAVSHEMRTPLTALLGFNQFLLENRVDERQQRECIGIMYKESRRLNDLISDFLDLQRIRAGEKFYSFRPLEVKELVESAARFHAQSSRARHRITVEPCAGLPSVLGDEACLHQVLNHLLANAIKYSPQGGDIVLGVRSTDDAIVLSVRDEGMGIPPECLGQVFDRFFRVDNTDSRPVGGTGLGLFLTREIVRSHGGTIWVESTPDCGSTFFVSLPAAPAVPCALSA